MSDTTSVPVKIDASALNEMVSKLAQQQTQEEYIEPGPALDAVSTRIHALFERFKLLNKISTACHGKKMSDPLPDAVSIAKITLDVAYKDAQGKLGDPQPVEIYNVACIGDLVPLINTEVGAIVYTLEQDTKFVSEIATKANANCEKARQSWEAQNEDRKIVRTDIVDRSDVSLQSSAQVAVNPPASAPMAAGQVSSDENKTV